jgi:hypothetical protein
MDQHVIYYIKRGYTASFLSFILGETGCAGGNLDERLRSVTLKEAVFWLAAAWENVPKETIQKSWKAILNLDWIEENQLGTVNQMLVDALEQEIIEPEPQNNVEFIVEMMERIPNFEINRQELENLFNLTPPIFEHDEDDHNMDINQPSDDEEPNIEVQQNAMSCDDALYHMNQVIFFMESNNFNGNQCLNAYKVKENLLFDKINNMIQ